ncbi:MAG: Dph6-related ATP pyrophosphatase, partial [Syntrophorhabdaceae bacterium]
MNNDGNDTFCSWSGGKESALSLHRSLRSGACVACLANMVTEDGIYSRTHGITASLLSSQADAIGIPLIQRRASWDTYETEYKTLLCAFHDQGIRRGIFGDIDLEDHRKWVERVSSECGISPFLPLWLEKREDILSEFIDQGFKALIVAVDTHYLDEGWLGREIDRAFMRDIS